MGILLISLLAEEEVSALTMVLTLTLILFNDKLVRNVSTSPVLS